MSRPSRSRPSGRKGGPGALAIAWILVLGVTAAATGFVVLELTGETPRAGAGLTIALPPAEAPEEAAETTPPAVPADPDEDATAEVGAEAQPAMADQAAEVAAEAQPATADQAAATAAVAPTIAPAAAPGPPRIAVVITGLGLSSAVSEQAIEQLPPQVSLSFSPYAEQLGDWIARARAKGHEVLIDLPMEPVNFPDDDPGPRALMTGLTPEQNLERLRWILDSAQGYVGVAAVMGSRFTATEAALQPVLETLKARGILFLDNRATQAGVAGRLAARLALPHAVNDRALDGPYANREAIDARLVQIERLALDRGFSVAMGEPYPLTLDRLANWAVSLEARGFRLAPISDLAAPRVAP